jgi:3'(2'), 5'-bisphosphate nucleotidase
MIWHNQIQKIIELSKEAGNAILEVYKEDDLKITLKSDASPLTRADMASHHLILEGLKRLTPTVAVLSEESKEVPYEQRQDWETFWLVDPLDGTKEFIKRNGEFTVNIALITNRLAVLGVVHAPALALTYYAAQGEGAFKQNAGEKPVMISVDPDYLDKPRIVASRSHAGPELEKLLKKVGDYECVSTGSSLKFCLVGDGTAQLYPRLGPTMEWDTAAGQCIVEVAGGTVRTLRGEPLRYNKPVLLNPSFMVSANSGLVWRRYLEDEQEKASD